MNEDYLNRLEKMEFHIRLLAESIDYSQHPMTLLVIENDWNENDLDRVHDIFERFSKKIESGTTFSHHEFEREFMDELRINYQELKSIVLAFFKNGQWVEVCLAYVKSFGDLPPIELKSIIGL